MNKTHFNSFRPLLFTLLLLFAATGFTHAQVPGFTEDTSIGVQSGALYQHLAWAGGFNNPQVAMADLNNDGRKDLVVYEWGTGQIKTFISTGPAGNPVYTYVPRYAANFPPVQDYLVMEDYNNDGISDLFHKGNTGFAVYRGSWNAANQLKFTFYRFLSYQSPAFGLVPAYSQSSDIPGIADIDGDGDLDFIGYNVFGTRIEYFKNCRVESGLPPDSIRVCYPATCWGTVQQTFDRTFLLGLFSCDMLGTFNCAKETQHAGNTMCLHDADGDGDMDLLGGNISFPEMQLLRNGKIQGTTIVPSFLSMPATGYNADIVANGTGSASLSAPANADGSGYAFMAPTFSPNGIVYPTSFLPGTGLLPSATTPGLGYQLQSYGSNNSLRLAGTASGTLTLSYPPLARELALLSATGGGVGTANITVTFTDASSQVFNGVTIPDWYGGSPNYAVQGVGRVLIASNTIENSAVNPRLYDIKLAVDAANFNKRVASVTVSKTVSAGVINVMGVAAAIVQDAMVSQDSTWQANGKKVVLPNWPGASWVDADADGKKDLVIFPHAQTGSENYKTLQFYRNTGTPTAPVYTFQTDTFLIDRMMDFGTASYPFLYDYNKDGRQDLIVGSDGYYNNGTNKCRLALYLNTVIGGKTTFVLQTRDFLSIGATDSMGAAPAVGDIDNDGKDDLVLGHYDGTLSFYKNSAASGAVQPVWTLQHLKLPDFGNTPINVGYYAAPFIYDMNGDGKKDMIIGHQGGTVRYYQNVGGAGQLRLQKMTDTLGGMVANPNNSFGGFSAPHIAKLTASGTEYLLLGTDSGRIRVYTGFQGGIVTGSYTPVGNGYINITNGIRSTLAVGDPDVDGKTDIIMGNLLGGLSLWRASGPGAVEDYAGAHSDVLMYPNPAKETLELRWPAATTDNVTVMLFDISGRRLQTHELTAGQDKLLISVSHYSNGVYYCQWTENGQRISRKILIHR